MTRTPYTLLIDGYSGAGKTTLALRIGHALGIRVVHMDDFYPGWSGLAEGARIVANSVLRTANPGYQQWDWYQYRPGRWVCLDPEADLIVEGVGAVTAASIRAAQLRGTVDTLRVELDAQTRQQRAFMRDAHFAPYWQMWAAQEARLEQVPVDVVVRG